MAIYKFRVTYEDHEDVYRDIEIKSTQNFEIFHKAIQEAIGFDNSKPASFYVSDDYWRKGLEITSLEEKNEEEEDDDDRPKSSKKLMNNSRLVNFIDDPHQKFLYVFDFTAQWTFCIELIKILLEEPKGDFPRCVKSSGNAPKQYKKTNIPPPTSLDEEDMEEHEEENLLLQEEAYDESDDGEVIKDMEVEAETGETEGEAEGEGEDFEASEHDEHYHEED